MQKLILRNKAARETHSGMNCPKRVSSGSRKCRFYGEEQAMNITYEKCGDYLIPNLIPNPEPEGELRKFGLMRKSYLENHRRGIYSGLLLSGELKKHLLMIQEQAEERFDLLVEQMAKQEGVTEQLKAQDQMLWVQKMNNIRARAEESVLIELIYQL